MAKIKFTDDEAGILYLLPKRLLIAPEHPKKWSLFSFLSPKPTGPIETMFEFIRTYTFFNRSAAPTFDEFAECITKAQKVGILHVDDGKLLMSDEWYQRIHADDGPRNLEFTMIEFCDKFVTIEFEETCDSTTFITKDQYEPVVEQHKREFEKMANRYR